MTERADVVIVGSGFAGAILARILARQGWGVVLLERGSHPRFALGESSTPLANLCLERLARRWDLPDLDRLAAHGRWVEGLAHLRRGLKRGFSFYRHAPGRPFADRPDNPWRLLVAASPSDVVSDTHWLREDVDRHLVAAAAAAGVDYRDRTEVGEVTLGPAGATLRALRAGKRLTFCAGLVIDATGPGGLLARCLPVPAVGTRAPLDTRLIYGHFVDVASLPAALGRDPRSAAGDPYPEEWAAVHHLLDEGWMYALRFDHGVVSAGFVVRNRHGGDRAARLARLEPAAAWEWLLDRYPSLAAQYGGARPVRPIASVSRLQHRMRRCAGPGWAMLPHAFAFYSPLFSTGIAWSLLAVERLAEILAAARGRRSPLAGGLGEDLARYGRRLERERRQMERLLAGAYLALPHFDLFTSVSFLYFAAVSFAESRQRLCSLDGDRSRTPTDFLGAGDVLLENAARGALRRLRLLAADGRSPRAGERRAFTRWMAATIAPRNVAGLADPRRRNVYPLDLGVLVERSGLLGLTPAAARERLHLLRGFEP